MLNHVDNGDHVELRVGNQLFDIWRKYFDSTAGRMPCRVGRLYAVLQKIAGQGIQEVAAPATQVEDGRISNGGRQHRSDDAKILPLIPAAPLSWRTGFIQRHV